MDMGEAALIAGKRSINGFQSFWIGHYAAVAAVLRNDMTAAAEHYAALAPDQGTVLYPSPFSADHVLGLLAETLGNLDDAQSHFEDALMFCRKAGYRPELAWSLCDYADMLLERKGDGDSEKAVELLDESLAISRELGMAADGESAVQAGDTESLAG